MNKSRTLLFGAIIGAVVGGELAEQPGRMQAHRVSDDLDDAPFADFVAVTERAVDDIAAPVSSETFDVGEHVDQSGGGDDAASDDGSAADEFDTEAAVCEAGDVDGATGEDLATVAAHFFSSDRDQFCWRQAFMAEVAVHVCSRGVAWVAGIDDDDRSALTAELEGGGEAGGGPADDGDIAVSFDETWSVFTHAGNVTWRFRLRKGVCRIGKYRRCGSCRVRFVVSHGSFR